MKFPLITLIGLLCLFHLSACGKNQAVAESEAEKSVPVADITRPPEFVVDKSGEQEEQDPDETISFDKWKKKQATDE
ncbi:MAG: hypothetical protein KJP04_05170 [Arenicella sp.]|nr:hypothetical protein [Arenicella sp.]